MGSAFQIGKPGKAADEISFANQLAQDELRRQFDITRGNVQPFIEAGQGALGDVQQGATIGGFGERLNEIIGGEAFQGLIGERTRAAQGQLSAGGLTRSGAGVQGIADISSGLAFDLEQLLTGRSQGLASQGLGAGLGLGQLGSTKSSNIANLFASSGQAQAAGLLGDAQVNTAFANEVGEVVGEVLPLMFSDPSLKENVQVVGEVHDLKLYQWDWIEAAKKTIVSICPTMGFMADEVKKLFPQHVHKYGGYDTVDYLSLLDEMDQINEAELQGVA